MGIVQPLYSEELSTVGLLCSEPSHSAHLSNILSGNSNQEIFQFKRGSDCLDFLRRRSVGIMIVTSEIQDMHWLTFLRLARTDESALLTPMVFVVKQLYHIELKDKELLSGYGISEIMREPFDNETFLNHIQKTYKEHSKKSSSTHKLTQAKELYRKGLISQAKNVFKDILQDDQNNMAARAGLMHSSRNTEEEYLEQLYHLLGADPKNYNFKFEIMEHHLANNQPDKFSNMFRQVTNELEADSDLFWLEELGEVCLSLKMPDFCERIGELMVQKNSVRFPWKPIILKARSRIASGHLTEAKILIDEAAKHTKGNVPEILNLQGIILRKEGDQSGALALFQKAANQSPYDHRIIFNIALCQISMEDKSNAIKSLERSIELCPTYTRAMQIKQELENDVV